MRCDSDWEQRGKGVSVHFTSDNQVIERRRLDVLRPLPGAVPHLVFSQLLGALLTHFVRVRFQALFWENK